MIDVTVGRERAGFELEPGGLCGEELARLIASGSTELPFPGEGATRSRFRALRSLGRGDLSLARLAEGHIDALAILHEAAAMPPSGSRLGVWAAGPVDDVRATRSGTGWTLAGLRRWCSGARSLTHALLRAGALDGERLFLVPLGVPGVTPVDGTWPAIGMSASETLDVSFDDVRVDSAGAVGGPGFYLDRDGFWAGGAGVAAVWLGGIDGILEALAGRTEDDPHRLSHFGWAVARVTALDALLRQVADTLDEKHGDRSERERLVRILRAEVSDTASAVIDRVGRATGAGPLAHDPVHARRVADLMLYVRQTHAEADLEAIARLELARREQAPR